MIDFQLLGMNYRTTTLVDRECFGLEPDQHLAFLADFKAGVQAKEAGLLLTCNRIEWYWSGASFDTVTEWLSRYFGSKSEKLRVLTYYYQGTATLKHLIRLAAGLESVVLGEPQIFGQLKTAFQNMSIAKTLGTVTQAIFPFVFSGAKKIRTQCQINPRRHSMASAAVNLATQLFSEEESPLNVLLVGAGETIEEILGLLREKTQINCYITNRTEISARLLADQHKATVIPFPAFKEALPLMDLVISATASPQPLISPDDLIKRNLKKTQCFIDLAMPRDIAPEVGLLPAVQLFDLDYFQTLLAETEEERQVAIQMAELIIEEELITFSMQLDARRQSSVVCSYREKMQQARDEELHKALQQLERGGDPEQVLIRFADSLTNKLMHHPTLMLKSLKAEKFVNGS